MPIGLDNGSLVLIVFGHTQRQETLDLRYLMLLCDNLKNRMFLQNFFSWHYFGNFLTAAKVEQFLYFWG
jgi:hypothetical protein